MARSAPSGDKSDDAPRSRTFTTVDRPTDSITPYERNPRQNLEAVADVAASIQEFGWAQPIVVDEHGVIIIGHTRHLAAKRLGLETVPVHVAEHLSPLQVKALRLADNRVGENAKWNQDRLALELFDLKLGDYELALTGFTPSQISDSLADLEGRGNTNRGSLLEQMEITIAEPMQLVERGQVWKLGEHRLAVVDPLREWAVFMPLLIDPSRDILCPFPGPVVALMPEVEGRRLILVQPDVYIAGHILDRYRDVNGEESASLQSAAR